MESRPDQPITNHFADSDDEKENQSYAETRRGLTPNLNELKEDTDEEDEGEELDSLIKL